MIPLRLVIDTNIIVSAALKPDGLERTVLLPAITKPATLYVSDVIVGEYREVLSCPELKIRKGLRHQFIQLIKNRSRLVTPVRSLRLTMDPDDNKFLECADAARADYLVTGNLRHFPKFWKNQGNHVPGIYKHCNSAPAFVNGQTILPSTCTRSDKLCAIF